MSVAKHGGLVSETVDGFAEFGCFDCGLVIRASADRRAEVERLAETHCHHAIEPRDVAAVERKLAQP